MGCLALPDRREFQETPALRVLTVLTVPTVQQAHQARQVLKENQDRKAFKVHQCPAELT